MQLPMFGSFQKYPRLPSQPYPLVRLPCNLHSFRQKVSLDGSQISIATEGKLLIDAPPGNIATDTRKLQPGDWFLALRGPNFDAHDFINQSEELDCGGVIYSSKLPAGWSRGAVLVPDTLKALQNIGRWVRGRFSGPVVGVTGSYGKTTTRAMIATAIGSLGHVHETFGNQNNHIGVPLTLLAMPEFTAACVIELGMDHTGEIAELADICKPDIRVVLNVGPVHLEKLGSMAAIAKAKGELLDSASPADICILNLDDCLVAKMPLPEGVRVLTFGTSPEADIRLVSSASTGGGLGVEAVISVRSSSSEFTLRLPIPGRHLAINACAAIAVALALGVPEVDAIDRLSMFKSPGGRLHIKNVSFGSSKIPGSFRIIDDSYNANPVSMAAAVCQLADISTTGRRVALLGDMAELGELSSTSHLDILRLCLSLRLDAIGLCGEKFAEVASQISEQVDVAATMWIVDDAAQLAAMAGQYLQDGDLVLIKGSRSLKMDQISNIISH